MDKLINKIFPIKCVICKTGTGVVCKDCQKDIKVLDREYCVVCDRPSKNGTTHMECMDKGIPSQLISIFDYCDGVREVIRRSKYYKKEFIGLKFLALYAINLLNDEIKNMLKNYYCLAVPPNPKNYKIRGFNQADLLLDVIADKMNLKKLTNYIQRKKQDYSQFEFNRSDRFKAVHGVFSVRDSARTSIHGKNILIIDDIVTSGATMLELSKMLFSCGVIDVKCFALSKKNKTFL